MTQEQHEDPLEEDTEGVEDSPLEELLLHTLDWLEEVADDLALNMPWEEAHKIALRDYLEELKTRYEEEFGEVAEGGEEEEKAGNA